MPIDFPNSPTAGDTYTVGSKTWQYDGTSWNVILGDVMLAVGSVTAEKISDGAITEAKLASGSVTSAKIADGTIVNADVSASAAINATKITNWEDDQPVLSYQIFS